MRYITPFLSFALIAFVLITSGPVLAADPLDPAAGVGTAEEAPSNTPPDTSAVTSEFGITPLFLDACWAGVFCGSFVQLGKRLNMMAIFLAPALFLCIFIIGAFIFTISAGRDQWVQTGKNMMKGSLLGLVVVITAYSVWRMTIWVLYGGFL